MLCWQIMADPLRHDPSGGAEAPERQWEDTGRVVRLRPRQRPGVEPGRASPPSPPPVEDIGKYERDGGDDDYRHRMIMNVIGFFACALLVVIGIWLANAIAELRKNQDCVLSGRRNCAQIEAPSRLRW
jgi:hypothetical protein